MIYEGRTAASSLDDPDRTDSDLAAALVLRGVEFDLLALKQMADTGALQSRSVNENVILSVVRLDETVAPFGRYRI